MLIFIKQNLKKIATRLKSVKGIYRSQILWYYFSGEHLLKTRKEFAKELGCSTECVNRYGRILKIPNRNTRTPLERFWFYVDKNGPMPQGNTITTQCWKWIGDISSWGYGELKYNGEKRHAHVLAYIWLVGELQRGQLVRHLCHNKNCVNPEHLAAGDRKDNSEDAKRDGIGTTEGENNPRAILTWEIVDYIRETYIPHHPLYGRKALAKKFGVSVSAISDITGYKSWMKKYDN